VADIRCSQSVRVARSNVMLRVYSVSGNRQRLDGGAMFGNAPRALWSRWHEPDEHGRIELACRTLLVDEGSRKVLLETGIGAFFAPELSQRYGVFEPRHVLLDSLANLGLRDSDIDIVVLSHLHFDHAGGLLSQWRPDQEPQLLFPKARFVVSAGAFERAQHAHLRDRASFIEGLSDKLQKSGRLHLVEDESPSDPLLGPNYRFRYTSGHTPALLHTEIRGERGSVFFCSDLIPGAAWVHLPITMGYDRYPERLIDEKARILSELLAHQTHLFFTHDPTVATARPALDERGRFQASDPKNIDAGWDLDLHAAPP
jgi:glyoxylase-like metal-dependent hydrolase (beta-lactamase superfamily II)